MQKRALKKIGSGRVTIFKLRNRKGYAAICLNNLTEGRSPAEAFKRLYHPMRRMGLLLEGQPPKPRR